MYEYFITYCTLLIEKTNYLLGRGGERWEGEYRAVEHVKTQRKKTIQTRTEFSMNVGHKGCQKAAAGDGHSD